MSLEEQINKELESLKQRRNGHVSTRNAYMKQVRANQKEADRLTGLIDDLNLMIEHTEAHMPHNPKWQVGDDCQLDNLTGTIDGISAHDVRISIEGGGSLTIDRSVFWRKATKGI